MILKISRLCVKREREREKEKERETERAIKIASERDRDKYMVLNLLRHHHLDKYSVSYNV